MSIDFSDMIGRRIHDVFLALGQSKFIIVFEDGARRTFSVCGDCCSSSWIEHLELPDVVYGATLLSVDDSGPVVQDHPEHDDEGSISVYNTSFKTDKGEIILEFRNSSNGYYGGYLFDEGW